MYKRIYLNEPELDALCHISLNLSGYDTDNDEEYIKSSKACRKAFRMLTCTLAARMHKKHYPDTWEEDKKFAQHLAVGYRKAIKDFAGMKSPNNQERNSE